jgi:hypothetical protein
MPGGGAEATLERFVQASIEEVQAACQGVIDRWVTNQLPKAIGYGLGVALLPDGARVISWISNTTIPGTHPGMVFHIVRPMAT